MGSVTRRFYTTNTSLSIISTVPSENKKDSRSIEQTLADIQSKKKLKKSGESKAEDCL